MYLEVAQYLFAFRNFWAGASTHQPLVALAGDSMKSSLMSALRRSYPVHTIRTHSIVTG
jgi:hypothetical protein